MAIDVSVETEIDRARQDVAAYVFDPDHDPSWISGISQSRLLTDRPVGKSTRVHRVAKFMGREIDYVLEVSAFEPGRLMVMDSLKSPFPMRVTYRFDDAGGGRTKAEVRVEGSPGGFYQLADLLTSLMVRNNITSDLKRLKKIMERSG